MDLHSMLIDQLPENKDRKETKALSSYQIVFLLFWGIRRCRLLQTNFSWIYKLVCLRSAQEQLSLYSGITRNCDEEYLTHCAFSSMYQH